MIKPIRDNIILEVVNNDEYTTDSGIIVSKDDGSKQYHGVFATVIAVGPNATGVKTGDTVIVNRYDLIPFRWNTKELQIVKSELIFAVEE